MKMLRSDMHRKSGPETIQPPVRKVGISGLDRCKNLAKQAIERFVIGVEKALDGIIQSLLTGLFAERNVRNVSSQKREIIDD